MPVGSRIRENSVFGTVADNPLSPGATTMNSNQLVLFPVISGDHAVITLDPLRQFGDPEIVVITSHTAAATSATIQRGQYGTTAREHPFGTVWVHALLDEDTIEILTSGTRPSNPYEGQMIFETDTNKFVAREAGNATWQEVLDLGNWDTYTPSNVNITVGDGTQTARFTRSGRTIFWSYHLLWGGSTSFGGTVQIGLPVMAASPVVGAARGVVSLREAGISVQPGVAEDVGTGAQVYAVHHELTNVGRTNATTPFTWGTSDTLSISGSYEAAS